jgi:hypothetical protein
MAGERRRQAGVGDRLRQRQRRPGLLRPLPAQDHVERAEYGLPKHDRRAGAARGHRHGGGLRRRHDGGGDGQGWTAQPAHRRAGRRRPGGALCARGRPRRRFAGEAHLAVAARDGLPQRRRPVADQHGLPRRHGGRAGGTGRQPRRAGRRTDRRLCLPPGGHGGLRDAQRHRCLPHPQQPPRQAGCRAARHRRGKDRRLGAGQSAQRPRPGWESGSAPRCAAWCSTGKPTPASSRILI